MHIKTYAAIHMQLWLLIWLKVASPASSGCFGSQLTAVASAVNPLTGSKLYDVTARTATKCMSACLSADMCLAVAFNMQIKLCTVFTAGNTSFNTAGLQVFVIKTKQCTDTSICPNQAQVPCSTVTSLPSPQMCCNCQGSAGNQPVTCQQNFVSFQAASSTPLTVPGTVSFNTMTVDHWSFNKQNNSFTAPVSGYYWLHVSIAIPTGSMAGVQLQGVSSYKVSRLFTSFTGGPDTASAATIFKLAQGTNLYLASTYPLYSDSLQQTSFGGFLLDSVMSPVVAFVLSYPTTFTTSSTQVIVPFNTITLDTHNGWRAPTSEYVVPVSGIYVLALKVATTGSYTTAFFLTVNGVTQLYPIYIADGAHADSDAIASLVLLPLNAGDRLSLFLVTYSSFNSLSFSGFLYSPSMIQAVAFSVAIGITTMTFNAPTDPIPYDYVFVNEANAWNPTAKRVIIPLGGVYYVYVQFLIIASTQCKIDLLLNGVSVMNVFKRTAQHDSLYQSSRGIILRLNTNDELRASVTLGSCISNEKKHMILSGFLIHT